MSNCVGCGVKLQTEDKQKLGYITKQEDSICERCFRLKNYGEYQNVSLDNQDYQQIIERIPKDCLVVYVADFLSLDLANIPKFPRMILLLTKRDILPKSVKDEKIISKIKEENPNFLDIISISSLTNYHLDNLYQALVKYAFKQEVYLIGNTNCGKSTLINKMVQNYGEVETKSAITVSMYPSTTLNKVEIKLKDFILIDTPGLIEEGNYINILEAKDLKKVVPKKEMKPRSCQIENKGSMLIGDYARIDYETKGKNSFVIYTAQLVDAKFISLKNNTYQDGVSHKYSLGSNQDIVLPGLGFIKFTRPIEIVIYTPKGIRPYVRNNLI